MRRLVVVAMVLLALSGCYCRRCQGQAVEAEVEKATVVVTSTECEQWRQDLYAGLNKLGAIPYEAICNLLLVNAYGFEKVPAGKETATITATNHNRMLALQKSIQAALGYRIIQQASVLQENREAVSAAIESATDTIKDVKAREAFLQKAKLLTGE